MKIEIYKDIDHKEPPVPEPVKKEEPPKKDESKSPKNNLGVILVVVVIVIIVGVTIYFYGKSKETN